MLLKQQKNTVYKQIEEADLSPALFNLESSDDDRDFKLEFKGTNYKYQCSFNSYQSEYYISYSPGSNTVKSYSSVASSWSSKIQYIPQWLDNLKREIEEPDLWELLNDEIGNAGFEDINFDNSKFTHQEYILLEKKIDDLKKVVEKLDLLEDQIILINSKLDHLLKMAQSLNKTDWKDLFIGSFISLIMQLSIDKATGQQLYSHAHAFFQNLISSVAH